DGIRDLHVTGVQTCALPIYGTTEEPDGVERHESGGGGMQKLAIFRLGFVGGIAEPQCQPRAIDDERLPAVPRARGRFLRVPFPTDRKSVVEAKSRGVGSRGR